MPTQREILEQLFTTEVSKGLSMLDQLCAKGLISCTALANLKIAKRVEEIQSKGRNKTDAVYQVADEFRISERKVYDTLKKLNE